MRGDGQVEALERDVLARALGKDNEGIGEVAGAIGGGLGGGAAGAGGGWLGGKLSRGGLGGIRFSAKRLGLDRGEERFDVDNDPGRVLNAARDMLARRGRLVEDELPPLHPAEVWGLVHTGIGRNPALARISAVASGAGCTVVVRTVALEGLIKQRTAQKNVGALRDELAAALGASR